MEGTGVCHLLEFINKPARTGNAPLLACIALHAKVDGKRHVFGRLHHEAKFAHPGTSLKTG